MLKITLEAGQRFGKLVVISEAGKTSGEYVWRCRCDCGKEVAVRSYYLRKGHTRSCGCFAAQIHSIRRKINIVGRRFGKLVVIKEEGLIDKHIAWRCKCDCGNEGVYSGAKLRRGWTKSCGCLQKEVVSRLFETHGLTKEGQTRFANIYFHLRRRCQNKNESRFKDYGGRGIKCLWESLEAFGIDMHRSYLEHLQAHGELNTTIERIDNNGPYSKDNCRWATRKEQNRNTRATIMLTFHGITKSLGDWADQMNLKPGCLYLRLHRSKWSIEKALTTPFKNAA